MITSLKAKLAALSVAALGLLVSATPAAAQFEQEDYTLKLDVRAANSVDFDGTIISGGAQLGYFFADQAEIGFRQTIEYSDFAGSDLAGTTAVYLDYYFGDSNFQPYVGLALGYAYGDLNGADTFFAGPEGGVAYFLPESGGDVFVFLSVQYQFNFEDADEAGESFDEGAFNYRLGLGLVF